MNRKLLCLLSCALMGTVAFAEEARIWTNVDGMRLEAVMVGVRGDLLVLRQPGGTEEVEVPLVRLSDEDRQYVQQWRPGQSGASVAAGGIASKDPVALAGKKIPKAVANDLVRLERSRLDSVRNPEARPFYILYFSAEWCPPCRMFTPELVKFYNELPPEQREKVEVVFISSDRSEREMIAYMQKAEMPWPALNWRAAQGRNHPIQSYAGRGIPRFVLVSAEGEELVVKSGFGDMPKLFARVSEELAKH